MSMEITTHEHRGAALEACGVTEPDRRPDPPVLGWAWLVVVVVCAPVAAAGAWAGEWTRGLVERSRVPARWRLPLLAGMLAGAALAGGLAWRWTMGW